MSTGHRPRSRCLLAGCGAISGTWLHTLTERDDVEVIGLVDLIHGRAGERAAEFGLESAVTGTSLEPMIEKLRPDVVLDCTVPETHADVACAALSHGCHVLSEKPMAATMTDAARILEAASAAGRVHAVVQQRRYTDGIRRFRALLASGRLGALTTLHADFFIGPHFGGFRDVMEHVLLLDMAIHTFDQARFITGAEPVAVSCHEWNPAGSWYRQGACVTCIFEMTDGIVFTYRGSWCAEGLPTTWDASWRGLGTIGSATWDGGERIVAERAADGEGFLRDTMPVEPPPVPALPRLEHAGAIGDFFACLRHGTPPPTAGDDNIRSLAMVHGAIRSAGEHRRTSVTWP